MDRAARLAFAGLALTFAVACGGPAPQPVDKEAARAEAEAKGRSTDQTVFDDMIKTEDKARAVEGVTMDAAARTQTAIDQQTDAK